MFRQAPSFPYHDLGIVEDGNTASRAISKDAYVIWKGESYFASTDILQGATLEEDVNLTAIPDGVINGVVEAMNNKTVKHKEVTLNKSTIGTSYSPTSRNIGTAPNLFGVNADHILAIVTTKADLTPAANLIFGFSSNNCWVAGTQSTTLSSDVIASVTYYE